MPLSASTHSDRTARLEFAISMATLGDLITRAALEELAGTAAYRRGEEYFSAGVVERLLATDDRVAARVEGTEIYRVELRRADDGELGYDCTCPRAGDGYFCKHCVAVGLAWLAEQAGKGRTVAGKARRSNLKPAWDGIRAYLTRQKPEALIELLLDAAQRDDRLYRSLSLNAERAGGDGTAAKAFRKAIDDVVRVRDFIDWRQARAFAANVEEVVDSLEELLKPDAAAALVDLCEYAIERLENSLQQIDDSNGETGAIVQRLGELHLKACSMARPEPCALAERLFRFEMTLPFGLCPFDTATYEGPLRKPGLRRFRELAETEWQKLKPLTARETYDGRRSRITHIMERLAEADGNMAELAAIKARDLSSSYRYLDVAETWVRAKRPDEALKWAERGLKAFRERPDNRLRDFLVAAYLDRGRNDEALQLTWIQFEDEPRLQHFKKLRDVAGKLGVWPAQRTRALSLVAQVTARAAAATNKWKPKPSKPDQSLRVEIALWEQDLDAAWTAAHEGSCNRHLLLDLAGKLEKLRTADAVSLYRRVVPSIVGQTNNNAYAEAIKVIQRAGNLMRVRGEARQFSDYLAELHVEFKAKRNFIKMLDGIARESTKG